MVRFDRLEYLQSGAGGTGVTDPLESQGSLTPSQDHPLLFAVNGGSSELSGFRIHRSYLAMVDKKLTGGAEPNAVAQHASLVYVLNVVNVSLKNPASCTHESP
ncbi:MAG TPA: hypothetical protein VIL63_08380 [Terriglobales bacterium]